MTTKDAKPKRSRARKPKPAEAISGAEEVAPAERPAPAAAARAGAEPEPTAASAVAERQPPPVRAADPASFDRFAELSRVVVFKMDGQRYALPIESVQEIQQIVAISEMPGSAGPVLGVINLRGVVIPAIDMRLLVGLPFREPDLETPMVLAYTAFGLVALVVDEVEDVLEVPPDSMQPASGVHALAERLLGVCRMEDGLVFVFDMDVLVPAEMVQEVTAP